MFNGAAEQYIKERTEAKCFVAKANYQQKRQLIFLRIITSFVKILQTLFRT